MSVRICPSILSADFARLAAEIERCVAGGADWIHIDVMDGHFVPNLTFGVKVIETVRRLTSLPLDVHLMVERPQSYFDTFVAAGADVLTLHQEATVHLHRQIVRIKELGVKAGVALNPATPVEHLRDVVQDIDLLLVMSVNPGYGGQSFIDAALGKIQRARALLNSVGSRAALEVDGGIARDTIAACWRAGADTFVAGHGIFGAADPQREIAVLRSLCAHTV